MEMSREAAPAPRKPIHHAPTHSVFSGAMSILQEEKARGHKGERRWLETERGSSVRPSLRLAEDRGSQGGTAEETGWSDGDDTSTIPPASAQQCHIRAQHFRSPGNHTI